MGKVLLVWRLVVKDIRHRPAQALLLLLAIAAGASTLTLGLALRGATSNPFARTQAATNGPDVVVTLMPGGRNAREPATPGELLGLEHATGAAAHSGPFPVTWTLLRTGRSTAGAEVEGRSSGSSPVDQPKLIHGSWVRSGGVVIEAGFAEALGVHVGDSLSLGGDDLEVAGTAVTAAVPDYPQVCAFTCVLTMGNYNPGLVWATEADANRIAHAAVSSPLAYYLNLKLTDPAEAGAFARNLGNTVTPGPRGLFSYSSQYVRDADTRVIANVQLFLFTGSSLLALLALASVAVLVGGRMAEQTRRVGLLKAVGGTPLLVAVVLLFENAVIGLAAAGAGLAAGRLAAPSIDGPGAGLLGAPAAPSADGSTIAIVIAMALAVAIAATFIPAIRAARQSTVTAVEDSARIPRRRASVIKLSAHLPAPLLLGVRLAVRRPRRLLLNLFSVAVTVSGLVAVLILHSAEANPGFLTPSDPLKARLGGVIITISAVLIVLAAINAVFIAWSTVLEARHASALARALGATPRQVTAGLAVAQTLPAFVGSMLGIPGGIGIYYAFIPRSGTMTMPSGFWVVFIVVATQVAVGLLTAIPTRIGARRPVAQALTTAS
jgi:ABC-type lipoprotein release transport system permease subunit